MRANYWSCSKFADWLRGTDKPMAETSEGWRDWKLKAKESHPIRYWLADEALDKIQNFIHWPADQIYKVKYWINNRFITKTHVLTSNLERGQWHEFEDRLLHCMFDELVNFVEVELAWCNIAWDKEARKKYNAPFYASGWFRWRTWRSPKSGLDYLEWASKLTNEQWAEEGEKIEPSFQALSAQETLVLYKWWKCERPSRPDPCEASGWSAICDARRDSGLGLMEEEKTEEDRKKTREALDLYHEIEEKYHAEDEQMMIRLIHIRRSLWT